MPKTYLVPAIKRAFDIINLLAKSEMGLTISQLHRTLKVPMSSTATILYTLENLGYVERDPSTSAYTQSMKLLGLSPPIDKINLVDRCHDLLTRLVAEIGLTGHLAVLRDENSMYVDRVPASGLVQFSSYIGMMWPAYASSVGKVLLAYLPPETLNEKLASMKLRRITSATITSKTLIEKQLLKFRTLGYAWEMDEGEAGVGCVAAPVFGPGSQAIAAVSVTGTTPHQINTRRIPRLAKVVVKYAELMSSRLGGKL
jgi:DNA-binding IclR family transcriptional regulator